jgi:uncharacterized membrane protein
MTNSQVYVGAALLGAAAGMRSMSPPATVSRLAHTGLLPARNRQLEILAHPTFVATATALAVGELIADKLPFVPARTTPGPLITRAISGAMCGAAVTSAKERSVLLGVLIGAGAAVGAAYGTYHLRRAAGESTGIPDPILALFEDAAVAASSWLVFHSLKTEPESV